MEDKEIINLCKKIYREHKEALDLIYDYADETEFEDAAREFIESIQAQELYVDGGSAWFIPSDFQDKFELIGEDYWCGGHPFAFWYTRYGEKLGIILEIGPFKDGEKRRAFLSHLKKHDFRIHDRSFKPGAKYTRIFTKYPRFDDWDSKESIIEKMDELYHTQAKNAKTNLLKTCSTFSWKDA
ncbi:MAG: hypothetical protein ACE5I1_21325 [bacterium]